MAVLAPQYFDPCGQLTQWCLINETTGAGNTVIHPGQLNLGVHWFGADLEGGDLAGWTKNKRLAIFLY